jgi:hypothetical protein
MNSSLEQLLQRGQNGGAVLFCGAGLTADCLNFDDDTTLGVTSHLLRLFNEELKGSGKQSGFRDIKHAAKRFKQDLGSHRMMQLLQDRFRLSKVSASIVDIVSYPWTTIYTTNYDNGLELALQRVGRKISPLNNLDNPNSATSGTPVIHLHGFAEVWTDATFEQSCVLDTDSYHQLSSVAKWLGRLRLDIERAEVVVFVGFSAADFHLTQVLFNSSGVKEKAFFINRPTAEPDPDERATQEEFGLPLYIGREEFAQFVTETVSKQTPQEPALASFSRYVQPNPSEEVPPVKDIEDLFIWGTVVRSHVKRDHDLSKSDYHVVRHEVRGMQEYLQAKGNIVLLNGDICDGKSLVIEGTMNTLAIGRPVFELRHSYADLLDETSSILSVYPNALLVVENCFSIREDRLLGLARQVAASEGNLILSARSISTEAESGKLKNLRIIPSFREMKLGRLEPAETDALIALIDQIAGWKDFGALSHADRQRFVERECGGVIPSVLLHLLESNYVKDRYREEYNKTSYLDVRERQMVIAALLIANIGFDAPLSFISDVFESDFSSALKRISEQSGSLRLVRAEQGVARTVPSIGARNLLKNVIEDREIVNTTIHILEAMADDIRRSDFQHHVFSQLMRYSILSSAVSDFAEINRFFDHISKISYFREMPLFWLQWHMAVSDQDKWLDAERYLGMGFTAAAAYEKKRGEKFNLKQLDDRRAKFLAARATSTSRSGAVLFRDMKEALDIVGRLIRDADLTHHPYETLLDIAKTLHARSNTILDGQRTILVNLLNGIVILAKSRIGIVTEGYQRSHAANVIRQLEASPLG